MMNKIKSHVLIPLTLMLCLVMPSIAMATDSSSAIDKEADELVKKMSDYMGSLKHFSATTQNCYESLLDSGQKVMFVNRVTVLMKRPGNLYVHRKGTVRDQDFYIHNKTLTLYSRNLNMYATTEVPASISEALDYATANLGLSAPGSDLFVDDIYSALMDGVTAGLYLGKNEVNGVQCHHVAFRSEEVDWQMWIEDGDRPVPRRYIITSKWLTGAPEYMIDIIKFDPDTDIPEKSFTFTPPENAGRIAFMTGEEAASAKKMLKKEIKP